MALLGSIVNAFAIILGGALGLLLKKGLPERISDTLMKGNALVVLYIGFSGALKGQNFLVAVLSMAVGGALGAWMDIDRGVNLLGERAQSLAQRGKTGELNSFSQGFVSATLLFGVGAMAVVGSLQSGLNLDHTTLYAKSVIDGVTAMVFAASLGSGVLLSAVPVFVYQGAITLLAGLIGPLLSDAVIADMTCAGSLIIIGIGLNLLGVDKIKVANFLPAIFLPVALTPLINLIG